MDVVGEEDILTHPHPLFSRLSLLYSVWVVQRHLHEQLWVIGVLGVSLDHAGRTPSKESPAV